MAHSIPRHAQGDRLQVDSNNDKLNASIIYARLKSIDLERQVCQNTLTYLQLEHESLQRQLREIENPVIRPRASRRCRVCGKQTTEFFGESPQCKKHTVKDLVIHDTQGNIIKSVGGDRIASALEELFND